MDFKGPFILLAFTSLVSCKSYQPLNNTAAYYNYSTECLGKSNEEIIVKAWGFGISKNKAIEDAQKNVIKELLSKGIFNGKPDCGVKPILAEIKPQKKDRLIKNYKKYCDLKPGAIKDATVFKVKSGVRVGVIVSVDLKKLNNE